ncbi:hypothetical protein EVA_14750 [gut metagenome]|uniref:Uncharacterized protein n=1 Tax=gut metagenome TaxID=749906 RepID=J9CB66_9ZZZZ
MGYPSVASAFFKNSTEFLATRKDCVPTARTFSGGSPARHS